MEANELHSQHAEQGEDRADRQGAGRRFFARTTATEARTASASATASRRVRWRRSPLVALVVAVGILFSGAIVDAASEPAYAADYPSWDDVRKARANETAKKAEISRIQTLLKNLEADVAAKTAAAEEAGYAFEEADLAFQEAALKAQDLQAQADAAGEIAATSRQQAGQMAAQLSRQGGGNLSASLLANPGDADDLLQRLGYASRITKQSEGLYVRALQDMNTAQSLADQAEVAREVREELRAEAEAKQIAAQQAADAANAALAEQEEHAVVLQAQLEVLSVARANTEAEYAEGERIRKEAEARAAAARAAAAAAAAANGGGGSTSTRGPVNGWVWPVNGWITGHYGNRLHPVYNYWRLHTGTDIGAGMGTPIYAATGGTVTYAGRLGTYGNFVLINHGNGISTGYAHIRDGGIMVRYGQQVQTGQQIAQVGSTGASTGPHLHFEVRINGVATNAVTYYRNHGIPIG
ncbi:M23 family metallopeptidase [Ruicaihuangia caeni]|uniref:M23 family metallopeptidase n=1 Tax=Ruicaihuangia caeni TaxID=3042517 RepID=UPI00338DDE23